MTKTVNGKEYMIWKNGEGSPVGEFRRYKDSHFYVSVYNLSGQRPVQETVIQGFIATSRELKILPKESPYFLEMYNSIIEKYPEYGI